MTRRLEFFIKGRAKAKPYHYKESGFDNIYLLNGVRELKTAYGPMIEIANMRGLHQAIGLHIAEKPEPMTGREFRFLRQVMRLTQQQLAALMHVTDQTIANYEKGKVENLGSADRFLRTLYLIHVLPEEVRMKILKPLVEEETPKRLPETPRRSVAGAWRELEHA